MMKQKLERIFLNNYTLKLGNGLNTVIEFMDKNLAKDELSGSLEEFEAFADLFRNEQLWIYCDIWC